MEQKIYQEILELLTEDIKILSNLNECFDSPALYFDRHIKRYQERGIDHPVTDHTIMWIAIADELIAGGTIIELDWKEELEEFTQQVESLATLNQLEIQTDWLEEDQSLPEWCHQLDEQWKEKDFCVGAMDIDSDSYVIFICRTETLQKLMHLAEKIHHRFDLAENM